MVTNALSPSRETAEVVHEALIRHWPRLVDWIERDRAFLSWLRQIKFNVELWSTNPSDDGPLLRGGMLAQARDWIAQHRDDLSPAERGYIEASLALQRRGEEEEEAARRAEIERLQELVGARKLAASQRQHAIIAGVGAFVAFVIAAFAIVAETLWNLGSAWQQIVLAVIGVYVLIFIALLLLARLRARAFMIFSDTAWASWLSGPFFFLRRVPMVQRWLLAPWFEAVRNMTETDYQFLDPPVSTAAGLSSEGSALLQRLSGSRWLWLHGRSGMGKSSVFAAWGRAYFSAEDMPSLSAAVHRYGFILIMLPVRDYVGLPVPDANRPESWVLEAVRRQLERFGFATRGLGLIAAMLRAGHIALALDGTNEADRDLALAAFVRQFPQTRLLVTSGALPQHLGEERWEIWELPEDISGLRDRLLELWLGGTKGPMLSRRIATEGLSGTIVSGYDLRLLADLAAVDPEHATLPGDRVALYREMLARAIGPDGQPLALAGLEHLAWTMMTQRRRRIEPDDEKVLGVGTLNALEREGLRIVRSFGASREFRYDQMRAFLAALWLVEETPTLAALQKTASDAGAFFLNRRDQEELWGFVAPLLTSAADLAELWRFANDYPDERSILLRVLQAEADDRDITLVRVPEQRGDTADVYAYIYPGGSPQGPLTLRAPADHAIQAGEGALGVVIKSTD